MRKRINILSFSASIIQRFVEHGFLERETKKSRTYYYITNSGKEELQRLGVDYNVSLLKRAANRKKYVKKNNIRRRNKK